MARWNELRNFDGTLFWRELPILDFTLVDGEVCKWDLHPENEKYYPLEFTYDCTPHGLNLFIESRIVPPTRQNLQRVLNDLQIDEYNWDKIIKANYGLCTDDYYWFRQSGDCVGQGGNPITYKDIKIRD